MIFAIVMIAGSVFVFAILVGLFLPDKAVNNFFLSSGQAVKLTCQSFYFTCIVGPYEFLMYGIGKLFPSIPADPRDNLVVIKNSFSSEDTTDFGSLNIGDYFVLIYQVDSPIHGQEVFQKLTNEEARFVQVFGNTETVVNEDGFNFEPESFEPTKMVLPIEG